MFSILGGTCQHPQTHRLTPFSLKSHCSGSCRVVLGHTVSFTLKLTGFGVFMSLSWPEEKVGRLGLGSYLPSLICLPAPRVQPLGSPYVCLALGWGAPTCPPRAHSKSGPRTTPEAAAGGRGPPGRKALPLDPQG